MRRGPCVMMIWLLPVAWALPDAVARRRWRGGRIPRPLRHGRLGLALAVGLVLLAGARQPPARAQGSAVDEKKVEESEDLDPWEVGTTSEQRRRARELMAEGNRLIRMPLFAQAAARYREALTHWDHPVLHYNLAVAQINLAQIIEAYRSFERALRHGPAALGSQDKYDQARQYLTILEERLARIEVVCEVAGAEVLLDGEPLFIGPGTRDELVSPGRHQLVATRPGHVPDTRQVAVSPGDRVQYVLAPRPMEEIVTRTERRWAAWKPWAVAGASAVFFAGAGYFDRRASHDFDRFGSAFSQQCPDGCDQGQVPAAWVDELRRAETDRGIAVAGYLAGGVVLGTGAILIYLNRERVIRATMDDDRDTHAVITITPVPMPRGAGIGAEIVF